MNDFDRAVAIIFELEGFDKEVVDTGGLTKWGISQKAYPDLDIRSLTQAQAKALYFNDYWLPAYCNKLYWPLNLIVFDAAVNQGVGPAVKMLQDAAGGLSVDGILGVKSIRRIQQIPSDELAARYMAKRALRYSGTRAFDKYGYGWFARLFRVHGRV